MFQPGNKVRPICDPTSSLLTVKRVSLHVDMVEMEEHDGWGWADNYILDDVPFEKDLTNGLI